MSANVDLGIPGLEAAIEIGRGGFAIVYRAEQSEFRRTVAVKVLTVQLDERAKLRFERECQALGSLSDHPGIVTVLSAGYTADGRPFLLMPFLAGGSLDDVLKTRGALPWPQVVDIGVRVSDALAAAHVEGILHRDLKPANILLSRHGHPVLADFGIARIAGSRNTTTNAPLTGSVHYMAPELVDGQEPAIASDIYALGATLYALLAGRPPFESDSDHSIVPVLNRIITQAAPPLEGVPEPVSAVLSRAMAKTANARHPDSMSFGRALQQAQAVCGQPITPLAGTTSPQAGRDVPFPTSDTAGLHAPPGVPDQVPWVAGVASDPGGHRAHANTLLGAPPPQAPTSDADIGGRPRRGLRVAAGAAVVLLLVAVAVLTFVLRGGGADYDLANARPSLPEGVTLDESLGGISGGEGSIEEDLPLGVARAYTVSVTGGQFLRVRAVSGSEGLDPVLRLLDQDGGELVDDDDGGGGLGGHDALLDWVFGEDGTYAVVVHGYDAESTGPYELVSTLGDPEGLEGSASGSLDMPYDAAVFRMDASSGADFTIVVSSEDFDARLDVLTPSRQLLEDDDGGGGTDPLIEVFDAEEGVYFIAVTSANGEDSGSFTVESNHD